MKVLKFQNKIIRISDSGRKKLPIKEKRVLRNG